MPWTLAVGTQHVDVSGNKKDKIGNNLVTVVMLNLLKLKELTQNMLQDYLEFNVMTVNYLVHQLVLDLIVLHVEKIYF
ncbi:MAG: hypothetical protein CM15mV51_0380 [uncultured marine virus]|nr:MAG: hypothetical protein CM15mV51_0380 [uncultured marine virus]